MTIIKGTAGIFHRIAYKCGCIIHLDANDQMGPSVNLCGFHKNQVSEEQKTLTNP